eukprot:1147847-Pelagomonas_calceolata.AAC.1
MTEFAINNSYQERQDLKDAKAALEAARQRQKKYADAKRRGISFNIGDEVLLSSKNIRLFNPGTPKLLPKWLGPFTIIDYCGWHKTPPQDGDPDYGAFNAAAYKLELPDNMRMHNVFQVSLLKPYRQDGRVQPPPIPKVMNGEEWFTVERTLDHRDIKVTTKRGCHARERTRAICQSAMACTAKQLRAPRLLQGGMRISAPAAPNIQPKNLHSACPRSLLDMPALRVPKAYA